MSRMWMLDVHRDPLRYRYRLCGTEMVRSLGREVTGIWLDEAHPQLIENPRFARAVPLYGRDRPGDLAAAGRRCGRAIPSTASSRPASRRSPPTA